jgi:tripartite-type tricarboxylate transporter receptor subunit TctC
MLQGAIRGDCNMKLNRPAISFVLGLLTISLPTYSAAPAQTNGFPQKTLRMIIPYPPGGSNDMLSRYLAVKLTDRLGQQIVIDNRGGAGGTLGAGLAAKAVADGYTLMLASSNLAVAVSLFENFSVDPLKDFATVSLLAKTPSLLAVHPSLPVKSVQELIALAKAQPGKINYAGGVGTTMHTDAELFKTMAHVDLVQIPYNGTAPALIAVLSGEAPVIVAPTLAVLPHVNSGRLRALAITSRERFARLPDLPTVAESGLPGFDTQQWYGILVPAGTPAAIVARLNAELVRIMHAPELTARMNNDASIPVGSTPQEFTAFFTDEIAKWAKVLKFSGARAY